MIDTAPPLPARRLVSHPTRLTLEDLRAILEQASNPDSAYRIDGWILMALAGELLAIRAGVPRERAPREPGLLPGQMALPFEGRRPEMGSGMPTAPGTPLVCEPKAKRAGKRRKGAG